MDAIELLHGQHEKLLIMLSELADGPEMSTPDQTRARETLVTRFVRAAGRHEILEQRYFWPMVRDRLPDGDTLAARAEDQEAGLAELFDALDNADPVLADFEPMVHKVIVDCREHIDYEQNQVWRKVVDTVDKAELAKLGEQLATARDREQPPFSGPSCV